QPAAVAAGLGAGADRGVGRPTQAFLGLGALLLASGQVRRRQPAVAGLLGRWRGPGHQPLILAELQSDVQSPRLGRNRGRGHGSSSVTKDTGVLPDGDLYHLGYLAGYMVSNVKAQQPGPPESLEVWKTVLRPRSGAAA